MEYITPKAFFMLIPTSGGRSRYIYRHKYLFHHVGENLFYQSRKFPSDPEYISFGNNVMVASDVIFINHDITNTMLGRCIKDFNSPDMGGN